jgi:hypothetical protein
MVPFLRLLLVATALLSSGVLQVVAAMGDDACCAQEAQEEQPSCPDCPPGLACACCPMRGAVEATPELAPRAPAGVALAVVATEPAGAAPAADIFHPPRA